MKLLMITTLSFLLLSTSLRAAQDVDLEKMKMAMQQYTQTGKEHEALKKYIGKWDVTIEMVMPGAPKQTSKGEAETFWAIKDRWLGQKLSGKLFGSDYESFSIHGYDTYAKNYVTTTVSSMDNSMNTTRGIKVNPEDSIQVEYGVLNEYMTGELNKPFKTVFYDKDENNFVMEIWDLGVGKEGVMVLKFNYKRKQAQ